jgi:fatty acid desaturase
MNQRQKQAFQESLKFKQQSAVKSIAAISKNYFFIALIIFTNLHFQNILLYFVSVWIIGAFQFALSECLLHESSHCNLFSSHKLNEYCEIFLALPFFISYKDFKQEHMHHHQHLLEESDHLYQSYRHWGLIDAKGNFAKINKFWHYFVRPISGIAGIYYFIKGASFANLRVIIFWIILFYLSIYFNFTKELFLFWIIPFIWAANAFLFYSETADHYNAKNKSSTRTSKISNWFFHNNGYHLTHHTYPFIPFFNLKKAYKKIQMSEQ